MVPPEAHHPFSLLLVPLWSYSYIRPLGRRVLTPGLISHLDSFRPVLRHEPRLWCATCRKLVFPLISFSYAAATGVGSALGLPGREDLVVLDSLCPSTPP